ncbi:TMhelix containing protein [Vibrio phage 2.275.O._10N.286.54.E11]|nr:TMhelix containing protein [Vibrio phage 2.275.O._10N.286.54.E11]
MMITIFGITLLFVSVVCAFIMGATIAVGNMFELITEADQNSEAMATLMFANQYSGRLFIGTVVTFVVGCGCAIY